MKKIIPLACFIVGMLPGFASATITGLSNTGTGLVDNVIDPNYTIISDPIPGPASPAIVATSATGVFPFPPWTLENAASAWITPSQNTFGPGGQYVYQTTFNVTGAATQIDGGWSTDNAGLDILINGTSLGFTTPNTSFSTPLSSFFITAAFLVPGPNTLDFVINNEGGPTGLRVEFFETSVIPLPAAIWLFGSGLLGLLILRRNKIA